MNKKFSELNNGDKFEVAGTTYVKIQAVKVSCCRSVNAHVADKPSQRTFFNPGVTVKVNA